jgi:hypothetical protein
MYKLIGIVESVGSLQQISDKISKREVVVTYRTTFGKMSKDVPVKFEAMFKMCDEVTALNTGDRVEISFDLDGRTWFNTAKQELQHFNSLKITSISILSKADNVKQNTDIFSKNYVITPDLPETVFNDMPF